MPTPVLDPVIELRYGCIYCTSGQEETVIESLEAQNPGLTATYVSQIKWKSEQGLKSKIKQITMPGYVYFRTTSDDPPDLRYIQESNRLLEMTKGSWELTSMDEWFAKWVFDRHGVIGFSKAMLIDNLVTITDGPLKDLEKYIVRIVKRDRCGQVALPFHGRKVRFWLMFELTG